MPTVRKFLDLSTAHLRTGAGEDDLVQSLAAADGVVAYNLDGYGWLMWVPEDPDESDEMDGHVAPGHILKIQRYARKHGCDYVLFDRDGPINQDLPFWE